jgi:Putative Ig domain
VGEDGGDEGDAGRPSSPALPGPVVVCLTGPLVSRSRLLVVSGVVGLALVLACVEAAGSARADTALPVVTVFGDSVADALRSEPTALAILSKGISLNPQFAPCRRVEQLSCPYMGSRPPTVLDVINSGAPLGDTVIVAVGYNDYEDTYPGSIDHAVAAMRKTGVKHVLWATLRAVRQLYLSMNDAIRAAAEKYPEFSVVDWNLYSRSHPDWFQPDGLHLTGDGAIAMATLFHDALTKLGIPVVAAPAAAPLTLRKPAIPTARVGVHYSVTLTAVGGKAPYRWVRRHGSFPKGLTLSSAGRIVGVPEVAGRFTVTVGVVDAAAHRAARTIILVVRAP